MRVLPWWSIGLGAGLLAFGCGSDDGSPAGASQGGNGGRGAGGSTSARGGADNGSGASGVGGTAASSGRGGGSSNGGGAGTGTARGGAGSGATSGAGTGAAPEAGGSSGAGAGSMSGGTDGMNAGAGGSAGNEDGGANTGPTDACAPAVARSGKYFEFPERFNRYYTDCEWKPARTVYVSPNGNGDGSSPASATSVSSALSAAVPGQLIRFLKGTYSGCFELDSDHGGTYDEPIVLAGERNTDGSPGATINCCNTGRRTCFNLEASNYVAIDGFELVGGDYGVRAVGAGYPADEHQTGTAVLNSVGHGQNKDPFFSGQSDWLVIQHCTAYDTGTGDGHGIYLSNGSDWNIARWNETYDTASADFQINADPASTCADEGVDFADPECDAVAGSHPTGGRGASDFMLIDANFFHHSQAQGPNFTSVRNSTIKNNVFAMPTRHGVSFWQETENPKLGSSNNAIVHNLFVTSVDNRQAIEFVANSTDNRFENNVVLAVSIGAGAASANARGQLLATDGSTVESNTFAHNAWISGFFGSEDGAPAYEPAASELRSESFDPAWFASFPLSIVHDTSGFAPSAAAPWLSKGSLLPEAPTDRDGVARSAPVDLGPYERPAR